ncbi:carbohydrate kinase family protein [Candidatus Falkowbacteria bacterium]|nr:carbohydrate kinase family protein [Candidatus Falkowbacteria bacterium]
MFDIISVGDITLDVFLQLEEAKVQCTLNKRECELCINYADKLPVRTITEIPAVGNAANNAVGSARLGLKTAIYCIVGNDASGKSNREVLKQEKVALDYVVTDTARSNYSVVLMYQGERTILVYHEPRQYRLPKTKPTKWLYFTSISAGRNGLQGQILTRVKKEKIRLGFNPGTHQLKQGLKALRPIIAASELLIVNWQEAERLVGKQTGIKPLLGALKALGPSIVVITDGEKGAYAFDSTAHYSQATFPCTVVERTGAGDAFATGCIAALVQGKNLPEALRWGTANAYSVIQYIGARQGLLNQARMKKVLQKFKNVQPKRI